MTRGERFSLWLRRRAESRAGLIGVFTWSFGEAFFRPIIPDAGLALLVASRPRRWLVLGAAAIAGTVTGGAAGLIAAAGGWTWPQPLTTTRMVAAVDAWLAAGAQGLSHQPLSGVPYKVFVTGAADAGIDLPSFVAATLQYRAPRLIMVAAATAVVAAVAWRLVPERRQAAMHCSVSAGGTVLLGVGLLAVVASWS